MGRGRGGGGSRRSSSRRSSSSRSFSSRRRSSSSRGGRSTSSFSRPSRSSIGFGGFSPRPPRPPHSSRYFFRRPSTYRVRRYGGNFLSIIIVIFLIIMAIPFNVRLSIHTSNPDITVSTVNREPLGAKACIESSEWFEDDLGWISSSSRLRNGLRSFYQETGVQPYLIITDNVNGKGGSVTDSEVEDYLQEKYDSLFADEGHLIYMFMEYADSEYLQFLYLGNQASTVIDTEAQEIIYDYADYYYTSDLEDDEYFSTVFEKSAERIMRKTTTGNDIIKTGVIIIGGITVIAIIGFIVVKKKKADVKEAEEKRKILETPIENIKDDDLKNKYQ